MFSFRLKKQTSKNVADTTFNRLRGGTTGKVYQRDLDMSGENVAYQRARTPGSEICFPNLSQGWTTQKKVAKKIWDILPSNGITITVEYQSTQSPEQMSRSGVSTHDRRFRMDSVERRLSKPVFEARIPGDRSFCFQGISPAPEVCGIKS